MLFYVIGGILVGFGFGLFIGVTLLKPKREEPEGVTLWAARNKDGGIWLHPEKPEKKDYLVCWHYGGSEFATVTYLGKYLPPELTSLRWEDDPIPVRLVIP